jgi:hypothetical protein
MQNSGQGVRAAGPIAPPQRIDATGQHQISTMVARRQISAGRQERRFES